MYTNPEVPLADYFYQQKRVGRIRRYGFSSHANVSVASRALRFAAGFDSVKVVLSGMSDMDQMLDNLNTFNAKSPLTDTEKALLSDKIVPSLVDQVPCTACRYCCEGCPVELNIPGLIQLHNELPHNCVGCGACTAVCPQGIDIPSAMQQLSAKIADMRK